MSIAGQAYGDIAPGKMSDYKSVGLMFPYATLKLHVGGKYITGQTLNFGSDRLTYRIDVADFDNGRLGIDLIRDGSSGPARPAPEVTNATILSVKPSRMSNIIVTLLEDIALACAGSADNILDISHGSSMVRL